MERMKKRIYLLSVLMLESFFVCYFKLFKYLNFSEESPLEFIVYFCLPIVTILFLFSLSGFFIGNLFKNNVIFIVVAAIITYILTFLIGFDNYVLF